MVQTQRVEDGAATTWAVAGGDNLPIQPVDE